MLLLLPEWILFSIVVRFLLNEALAGTGGASIDLIIKIGVLLLGLYIISIGCNYFITAWGHIIGARMEYDMRNDIFNHLQNYHSHFMITTKLDI